MALIIRSTSDKIIGRAMCNVHGASQQNEDVKAFLKKDGSSTLVTFTMNLNCGL